MAKIKEDQVLFASTFHPTSERAARKYVVKHNLTNELVKMVKRGDLLLVVARKEFELA